MPTLLAHVLAFAGAALLLAIAPGPATAVLLRNTIRHGRRRGVATVAGIEAGVLFWAVTAAVGLTALLAASTVAYDVLRFTGAVVLIGLGAQALVRSRHEHADLVDNDPMNDHDPMNDNHPMNDNDKQPDAVGLAPPIKAGQAPRADTSRDSRRAFRSGLITNMANPKAGVFAISFLPQFIPRHAPVLPTALLLAVVWVACDCAWYLSLTVVIHAARRFFARGAIRRRLEALSGVALVGFGVRLALQQR